MPKYKKKFTESELEYIEGMSSLGLSIEKISKVLKMSESVFDRALKNNAALRKAMEQGRAKVSLKAREAVFSRATERQSVTKKKYRIEKDGRRTLVEEQIVDIEPSDALLQFWCNTQEDFKVKTALEVTGADGRPIEMTEVPMEELEKEVERLRKLNSLK